MTKWKLVPVEPTPETIAAIEKQWMIGSAIDMAKREYKAMLEAAPPHQSEHHLEMVNTPVPSVPDGWRPFLTDVITAAGLLEHGKRDKGLARRIGKFAFDAMRAAAPQPPKLSDERIFDLLKQVDPHAVRLPLGFKQFAIAIEREIFGGEA